MARQIPDLPSKALLESGDLVLVRKTGNDTDYQVPFASAFGQADDQIPRNSDTKALLGSTDTGKGAALVGFVPDDEVGANKNPRPISKKLTTFVDAGDFSGGDDYTKLQRAADQLKTLAAAKTEFWEPVIRLVLDRDYVLNDTLDLNGIRQHGVEIDFNGHMIYSTATGKAAIELLDSRWLNLIYPYIVGDETNTPRDLLYVGRDSAGRASGSHRIYGGVLSGFAQQATFLNYGSEENKYFGLRVWHRATDNAGYAIVNTGNPDDFDVSSENVTAESGNKSMNGSHFNGVEVITPGAKDGGHSIYLSDANDTKIEGYSTAYGKGHILVKDKTIRSANLMLAMHAEPAGSGADYYVDLEGSATVDTPIGGLTLIDHVAQVQSALVNFNDHAGIIDFQYRGRPSGPLFNTESTANNTPAVHGFDINDQRSSNASPTSDSVFNFDAIGDASGSVRCLTFQQIQMGGATTRQTVSVVSRVGHRVLSSYPEVAGSGGTARVSSRQNRVTGSASSAKNVDNIVFEETPSDPIFKEVGVKIEFRVLYNGFNIRFRDNAIASGNVYTGTGGTVDVDQDALVVLRVGADDGLYLQSIEYDDGTYSTFNVV